jgi:hypothetical protein
MRTAALLFALLASGAAIAQPDIPKREDRHPAYVGEPPPRVVPIERIHTFEQRWEPVLQLLHEQRMRQGIEQNAPAVTAAHAEAILPRAKPQFRRSPDLCERHGLRKVNTNGGRSWRCR